MAFRRIVHVDDNQDYCGVIRWAFCSLAPDIEIKSILSGEDALAHFELCGSGGLALPELLLVDLRMPGMDGFDVVRAIRKLPQFAAVPIYMLSSNREVENVHEARQAGADGYIGKPAGEEMAMIRELLERHPWRRAEIAHELSTALMPPVSLPVRPVASSPAMCQAAVLPVAPAVPPMLEMIAHLAGYCRDVKLDASTFAGVFIDQDELDISFAERQARITRWDVQNTKDKEHTMEQKRRKFFGILLLREWGISQIQRRFPDAKTDYLKKIRGEVHRDEKSRTNRALSN